MNGLDIVIVVLLGFGIYKGFKNGLFVEIASLVALLLGIYGAIHFSDYAANYLSSKLEWSEQTINIAAFALTFISIIFVITLAGKALTKLADFAALGLFNKLLGAFFSLLKYGLILSIALNIFEKINQNISVVDNSTLNSASLYEPVKSIAPQLFPSILNLKAHFELNEEDTPEAIGV